MLLLGPDEDFCGDVNFYVSLYTLLAGSVSAVLFVFEVHEATEPVCWRMRLICTLVSVMHFCTGHAISSSVLIRWNVSRVHCLCILIDPRWHYVFVVHSKRY